MQAAGFVLVGGNSSRMGRDKALLPGRSRHLIEEICERLKAVTDQVFLVGNPDRYRHLQNPCIPDLRPALGPLSGLETALSHTKINLNVVLACDMPDVNVTHLSALLERARTVSALCVATRDVTGQVHPLAAVYHRDCLSIVKRRLDEGRLSLLGLLEELQAEYVDSQATLENLNTPEDYSRWQA